jgi:hypothetical protein
MVSRRNNEIRSSESVTHSLRLKIFLATLGLAGVALVLLATIRYGAALSTDSVTYVAAARNLATSGTIPSFDGVPLVVHGPLYPATLAIAGHVLGVDPVLAAHIVNALSFGLIVYLSGLLTFRHLASLPAFALLGSVSVSFSVPLIEVLVTAWSEPLFICFVLLFIISSESHLNKRDKTSLVFLSLSAAIACLTRYIGVASSYQA